MNSQNRQKLNILAFETAMPLNQDKYNVGENTQKGFPIKVNKVTDSCVVAQMQ